MGGESYIVAMGLCTAGVISAYVIARLTETLFPPKGGQTHIITTVVTAACLLLTLGLVIAGVGIATQYFGLVG